MIRLMFYFLIFIFSLSSYGMLPNQTCEKVFTKYRQTKMNANKFPLDHPENLRHYFDHTLLKPEANNKDIINLIEEAVAYKLKSICVNSCRVHDVNLYLEELRKIQSYTPLITAVIAFPLGADLTAVKAEAAKQAVAEGANELDMVINIGHVKDGKWSLLKFDIESVVKAVDVPIKVIIETDLLTEAEIEKASEISVKAGAHFVKTSTGFVPNGKGALLKNIELMQKGIESANLPNSKLIEIKASGGVKTLEQAIQFLKAGVSRLGSSRSISIMEEAMKKYDVKISEIGSL